MALAKNMIAQGRFEFDSHSLTQPIAKCRWRGKSFVRRCDQLERVTVFAAIPSVCHGG
jgi:hypothetical protein